MKTKAIWMTLWLATTLIACAEEETPPPTQTQAADSTQSLNEPAGDAAIWPDTAATEDIAHSDANDSASPDMAEAGTGDTGDTGGTPEPDSESDGTATIACEIPPVEPEPCEDTRPIVVAHGYLASCDTYANHAMRLASNGFDETHIHPFDWNSTDDTVDHAAALDAFNDSVLAGSTCTTVDLMGHSAGEG